MPVCSVFRDGFWREERGFARRGSFAEGAWVALGKTSSDAGFFVALVARFGAVRCALCPGARVGLGALLTGATRFEVSLLDTARSGTAFSSRLAAGSVLEVCRDAAEVGGAVTSSAGRLPPATPPAATSSVSSSLLASGAATAACDASGARELGSAPARRLSTLCAVCSLRSEAGNRSSWASRASARWMPPK